MSAVTRVSVRDIVVFKDAAGKERRGVALQLRSDYALVGVQLDPPTVTVRRHRTSDGSGYNYTVPNNAIFGVPYTHIVRSEIPQSAE